MRRHRTGRKVRRHDTGEVFNSVALAAASAEGCKAGLAVALRQGREFKGIKFSYVDESSAPTPSTPAPIPASATRSPPVSSPPATLPPHQKAFVSAEAASARLSRIVEPSAPVSVTSVFAALSSMAVGMKGLRLTNIEISVGELKVKVEQLELMGAA